MIDESMHEPSSVSGRVAPPALWYTVEDGVQAGPWSLTSLHDRGRDGLINSLTLVWTESMTDWEPYGRHFGLAPNVNNGGAPVGQTVSSQKRARPNSTGEGDGRLAIEHSSE